ncbi:MAG: hypothetical protein DHS20C17_18650 [Cyclobacteriaceae bacterium]|nr:MAG: hypothetical protein DHS20C17_18650 [Cyclobacteriaceae bacterium]
MIDTIVAGLETKDINGIIKSTKMRGTRSWSTASIQRDYDLGNLRIKVIENAKTNLYAVTLEGSLNKYIHGNNVKSCTRLEIKEAITEISDLIEQPIYDATVYRIDIGRVFVTEHTPSLYNLKLSHSGRYKKSMYNDFDTLYFSVSNRELIFYDKAKEVKPKAYIPKELIFDNLLRYEFRLRRKISEYLKRQVIVRDLFNKEFYCILLNMYEGEYFKVVKNPQPILSVKPSTKILTNFFALWGIKHFGGIHNAREMIKDLSKEHGLNAVEKKRLLDKVDLIATHQDILDSDDLIEELNRKVRRAVEFYL